MIFLEKLVTPRSGMHPKTHVTMMMSLRRTPRFLLPPRNAKTAQRFPSCLVRYMGRRSATSVDISWSNRRQDQWPISCSVLQTRNHQNLSVVPSRRPFSSETNTSIVYSNDGLIKTLVHSHLESIRQLPEVDNALQHWDDAEALEELQRAVQVFEMMEAGGSLHVAVLALLAECFQHQGNYDEAFRVLQTLQQLVPESNGEARLLIDLASAKTLWYQGDFGDSMVQVDNVMENDASLHSKLTRGCVMNAQGIIRLMIKSPDEKQDGGESVVQVLKDASDQIEKDSGNNESAALAGACARGNLGVAMILSKFVLDEVRLW